MIVEILSYTLIIQDKFFLEKNYVSRQYFQNATMQKQKMISMPSLLHFKGNSVIFQPIIKPKFIYPIVQPKGRTQFDLRYRRGTP